MTLQQDKLKNYFIKLIINMIYLIIINNDHSKNEQNDIKFGHITILLL